MKDSKNWTIVVFIIALIAASILAAGCAIVNTEQTSPPAVPSRAQFQAYLMGGGVDTANLAESGAPVIYDYSGNVRDTQWLRDEFGDVGWQRTDPHPDAPYVFRVTELRGKCGPASLIVRVIDENGNPLVKYAVVRYWPGAPSLPDFSNTTARQWTTEGVVGRTNDNGDVGFGMGIGDYYWPDKGESGASKVYVADFDGYGDLVFGLGMLAATDHCHVDTTFQRLPKDITPPTPTPTPGPSPTPGPAPSGGWDIDLTIKGSISPSE